MKDEFEKYGFKFIRANEDNIELIRNWRNSDFIRYKMINQNIITREEQINWFKNLDKVNNHYYIAQNAESLEYVGVVYLKILKNNIGEPGSYLIREDLENTATSTIIQFAFSDYSFDSLGVDILSPKVNKDNTKAFKLNMEACKLVVEKSTEDIHYFEISKKEYFENKKINKLKTFLTKKLSYDKR